MDQKRRRIDAASPLPRPHRRRRRRRDREDRRKGYSPASLSSTKTSSRKSRPLFSVRTLLIVGALFIVTEAYVISTKSNSKTFDVPAIDVAEINTSDGDAPTVSLSPLPQMTRSKPADVNESPYGFQVEANSLPAPPAASVASRPELVVPEKSIGKAELSTDELRIEPIRPPSNPGMTSSPIPVTRTLSQRNAKVGAPVDLADSIASMVNADTTPSDAPLEPVADMTPNTSPEVLRAIEESENTKLPLLGFTRHLLNQADPEAHQPVASPSEMAMQNPFLKKEPNPHQTGHQGLFAQPDLADSYTGVAPTPAHSPSPAAAPNPTAPPSRSAQVKNDLFGAPDRETIQQTSPLIVSEDGLFRLGPETATAGVTTGGIPTGPVAATPGEFSTDPKTGAPVLGQWDPIDDSNVGYVDALGDIAFDDSMDPQSAQWWLADIHGGAILGRHQQPVTLNELVVVALQAAPQLRVFAAQPVIESTRVNESIAAFDWTNFLETAWDDTSDPVGSTLDTGTAPRLKNNFWTMQTGVRKLNRIGGQFEYRSELSHLNSNSDFFVPNNQGRSRMVLSYTQPLLNGAGRALNESQIVLADLNTAIATNDTLASTQQYVLDVIAGYWEVYFQRGLLAQARRSYDRALEIEAKLNARKKIDADPQQIIRVKAAAAARRSAVINADTALKNAQDQLLSLVVGPAFTHEAGAELIPQDYPQLGDHFLEFDHEVATALQMRPEVYITVNQLRSASVNLRVSRNDLLPRLDAFLETYVAGLEGNSDVFRAIRNSYNEGEPGYSVGLRYEVPFGRRAAKARNARARLELQQLEDSFQALVANITVDVRTAVREIERLKSDLLARNNQLLRAIEELRYLEARYELKVDRERTGSIYLEDLLGSQQRLFEAESALLRTQTDLAVAIADMQRANGMLLRVEGERTLPMDICDTAQPIATTIQIDPMTGVPMQGNPVVAPAAHITP